MKYPPYPKYKSSGIEWLGDVPEHWTEKRVKHLFVINKRIAGEEGYDVLSITQKGIKVKDTESGEGQLSMDYSKYQFVEIGDFAMNHMDLLTGYVDISSYYGVTSPDYRVFSLIDKNSLSNYYLYIMQMGYKEKIFFSLGQGVANVGRWRLQTEAFNNFSIPYPPFVEQKVIASFLDIETKRIDNLIEEKENFIGLLKEKHQATVHHIIHKEGTVNIRLGMVIDRMIRPVSREVGEEFIALGLYNKGRGIFHKPSKEENELGDSDFFWVQEDDLILSGQFAWEGSVALAGENENNCVVSHRYPVIRGKNNVLNTEYLWAYLTTQDGDFLLNNHSVGSAGRNRPLNMNTMIKEKIPVPTMEDQLEVSRIVKAEQRIKKETEISIELLKEHRTALISAAVTGKIDVRHLVQEAA